MASLASNRACGRPPRVLFACAGASLAGGPATDHGIDMKCSAEIGPRKWPYGGNWPAVLAMVTAAVVLVLVPAEPAWARRSAPSIWRELFGAPPKPHRQIGRAH